MNAARRRLVRRLPENQRLAAISAGLAVCAPAEAEALGVDLVELSLEGQGRAAADAGLVEVIRRWDRLPPSARSAATAAGRGRWPAVVRELAATGNTPCRDACLSLFESLGESDLLFVLPMLVGDSEGTIARRAERLLLATTEAAVGMPGAMLGQSAAQPDPTEQSDDRDDAKSHPATPPNLPDAPPGVLVPMLADAAATWETHQSRAVMLAITLVLAADDVAWRSGAIGARLSGVIKQNEHAATALRGTLRWSKSPAARTAAWRCLGTQPDLAAACIDRVAWASDVADHEALCARAALLARPARRAAWSAVSVRTRPGAATLVEGGPVPDRSAFERMNEPARAGVARLVSAMGGTAEAKRAAREPALADPSGRVRLATLSSAPAKELEDWVHDTDPAIAHHAALRWSMAGIRPGRGKTPARAQRTMRTLSRSPHAAVRRWSAEESRRIDPWAGAGAWSRVAARQALAADAKAFMRELAARCLGGEVADRISALSLVRPMKLSDELVSVLERAAGDSDDRVAATAARALEGCTAPKAADIVRTLLGHHDGRVRSNATEAMAGAERHAGDLPGVLVELQHDAHHRVRGSAVREGVRVGGEAAREAVESLKALISDRAVPNRLAGVWAADRVIEADPMRSARDDIVAMLAVLSEEDADVGVRRRAAMAVRRGGRGS